MLSLLYPFLIIVGITIAFVLAYLAWQARAASHLNLALIQLNEEHQFDTPLFLKNAWPLLQRGGILGFTYQLNWFGIALSGSEGKSIGRELHRRIHIKEMSLDLIFFQNANGERFYFNVALIDTFLLLLRCDMWIKAGTLDATLDHMTKLNLFMQHDMKNIAQFIQLMADQLSDIPEGKEQQVLNFLGSTLPLIRDRADHIVQTLAMGQNGHQKQKEIEIADLIHRLGLFHQLDYSLKGCARLSVHVQSLDSAIDNIFKNYYDLYLREGGQKPRIDIEIKEHDAVVEIRISSVNKQLLTNRERLFEPFWSMNADGLGIGLYQARYLLKQCQGCLELKHTPDGNLEFNIKLPRFFSA